MDDIKLNFCLNYLDTLGPAQRITVTSLNRVRVLQFGVTSGGCGGRGSVSSLGL